MLTDLLPILYRWWVNAFFTAITPFLDPVTKEKVFVMPATLSIALDSNLLHLTR